MIVRAREGSVSTCRGTDEVARLDGRKGERRMNREAIDNPHDEVFFPQVGGEMVDVVGGSLLKDGKASPEV